MVRALAGAICLFGLTATVAAAPKPQGTQQGAQHHAWDPKPTDHPKLDRKLNDRSDVGDLGVSRVIVVWKPGWGNNSAWNRNVGNNTQEDQQDNDVRRLGGKAGRKLNLIGGQVVELPNAFLRKLADHPGVADIHWDRPAGGKMNRAAVTVGARAVQEQFGYDGAGVGVAVIDSGITAWHDDLTYQGTNGAVKVVGGQRLLKFVDFVNGRTTPYDDNGHGSHVAGIILGNGYDTQGARAGIAPAANLVSLKVLDDHGGGYISNVIAALDWAVTNKAAYNIRVINLSVGARITESFRTDPLTLAAKRAVDAGIVVVTAAGNLGRNAKTGLPQYGAITAPGNAPWVLTVGAYNHQGTVARFDDTMAPYSSRGPSYIDYGAKPDVVAPGTGIVSLAVQGSTFYTTKAAYLLDGSVKTSYKPYLSLTGTSMAAPMVTGTVALMLQANPTLTPNLVKAIIEYTAQKYRYDALTQGAGFLNTHGAVTLARFYARARPGDRVPSSRAWSKTIIWGNHQLRHGLIKPQGNAWAQNVVWGATVTPELDNIVWGTSCGTMECDNIVWGTALLGEVDNIVWGTALTAEVDNIVWGTTCAGADCASTVWGTAMPDLFNIVWGTTTADLFNIVWGTAGEVDNIVWGTSSEPDNATWGTSGEASPVFDDPTVPSLFDGLLFDSLFDAPPPPPPPTVTSPPPGILPESATIITTVTAPIAPVVGGF